ncbi:hypothetical protein ACSVH2_01395 [Flavobacterium sp. RSB2_4_14]|uniref:hypothetical protein n=1 Tax=Flavobacterium sp. RSB2_4_14 TaxID=3447665 RepID=UPI003F30A06C
MLSGLTSGEISKNPNISVSSDAPEYIAAHTIAQKAEDKVNVNTRIINVGNTDSFIEKDGTNTTQTYNSTPDGGYFITKTRK